MKSLCPADTPPVDTIITFFILWIFLILLWSCLTLSFKIPRYINLKFSFSLNDFIYSGNDGGLYVSTDNGDNWTDISDGLQITQFYSLGVSQTVQDMVITGSQDNGTFLKNGNNWDPVIGGDGMECIIDYTN